MIAREVAGAPAPAGKEEINEIAEKIFS